MKKNIYLYSVLIPIFILTFCLPAKTQSEKTELINSYWLTDRIFIVRCGDTYPDMIAAVKTKKGIVIIDSGISPSLTAIYRKIIEKEFKNSNFKYVINTHHHFDHTNGNQVFKDTVIIAHHNAVSKMKSNNKGKNGFIIRRKKRYQRRITIMKTLDKKSGIYKRLRDLVFTSRKMCEDYQTGYQLTLPDLTFSNRLTLDMGDLKIEIVYFGPGFHTDNDLLISIPEENVVFSGDILRLVDQYSHLTSKSDFDPWITSLDILMKDLDDFKIITIHEGILPGDNLIKFSNSLKAMRDEHNQKKNAIDNLQLLISSQDLNQALKIKVKNELFKKGKKHYYIREGDIIDIVKKYVNMDKYNEALYLLELCGEYFPESTNVVYWKGEILMKKGDHQSALRTFKKAFLMDPLSSYTIDMIFQLENRN